MHVVLALLPWMCIYKLTNEEVQNLFGTVGRKESSMFSRVNHYFSFITTNAYNVTSHKYIVQSDRGMFVIITEVPGNISSATMSPIFSSFQ